MIRSRNNEGHRHGGPRFIGTLLLVALVAACGGRNGEPGQPSPEEDTGMLRPLDVYRDLGLIVGTENYPAVAGFSTFAGPADSTYVLFGLSLPNSALRFQRETSGFVGRYAVSLRFEQEGRIVRELDRDEVVRIGSFGEASRTDESVIFQELVAIPPGTYAVDVEARDAMSSRALRMRDTLTVPEYGERGSRIAPPLFVYRSEGRSDRAVRPELIVNPRNTIYYGGVSPRLYLEAYGLAANESVHVRVVDGEDESRWETRATLSDGSTGASVQHALVDIPSDSLPLGRLWVELTRDGDAEPVHRMPLIVTISDAWLAANFEEVLNFIRYIATDDEMSGLRDASGAERQRLWAEFWERRDPVAATPINEFQEEFFQRVRLATTYFGEPGSPGWRTDRGEVYIVLGPPDRVVEGMERSGASARPNTIYWLYEYSPVGRLELAFIDRRGFGNYELTVESRNRFRAAAQRIRARR